MGKKTKCRLLVKGEGKYFQGETNKNSSEADLIVFDKTRQVVVLLRIDKYGDNDLRKQAEITVSPKMMEEVPEDCCSLMSSVFSWQSETDFLNLVRLLVAASPSYKAYKKIDFSIKWSGVDLDSQAVVYRLYRQEKKRKEKRHAE